MFGTNATLGTDLTLLAEVLFFILLTIGVVVQRQGKFKLHDLINTPVVILNTILVIWIMVSEFLGQRIPQQALARPNAYYVVAALHGLFGLTAAILSIYCLLAGWKILPRKIGQLRKVMWVTYIVWAIAVTLGIALYYIWYVRQPEPVALPDPTPTAVVEAIAGEDDAEIGNQPPPPQNIALVNFEFNPADLTIPAGTQVTWTSQDNAPHNVTFVDGSLETENFFAGESAEFTFTDPGTYVIYCTIHGDAAGNDMASVITVVEQPADAEPIAAVTAVPTIAPTEEPTAVPTDTPTPEPTVEIIVEEVGYDTTFLANAAVQMATAREHAALMLAAFNAGDMDTTRREAEQVVNVINGESADLNNDGTVEDPSDGQGLLFHLRNARNQAEVADVSPDAEASNATILDTVNYAIDQLELAINEGISIIDAPIGPDVEALVRMLGEADDDGGLQEAIAAATLIVDPAEGGEVEAVPTAEPTPEPVVVTVDMEDFEFVSNNVTIKTGTTITWINVGNAQHSAQAEDGSFDTTLFGSGEERSFTFDETGTFAYFCELHGASEGRGMSGVIVVEE